MPERRLPSFNDFSPVILQRDLRKCLLPILASAGDDDQVTGEWTRLFFKGKSNRRSSTNIPATLRSTGLTTGTRPMVLSEVGKRIAQAKSAEDAHREFCSHLLREKNGDILVLALQSLVRRGEKATKSSLQNELRTLGIEALSTATTDHTTFKNWLIEGGFVDERDVPRDDAVKRVLGISVTEMEELCALPLSQQVFLHEVRRHHISGNGPFPVSPILKQILDDYADLFDSSHFAKDIRDPLVAKGWISFSGLASGPNGGKSGSVIGTEKLLSIPVDRFVPDFEAVIPAELRAKINIAPEQLYADLIGDDRHKGGLALELLALRMILDLGLNPRSFRLRSAESAHAEVDLIAEASHLMFSRWTIQCKRYAEGTKVQLSDVAKEVGIAIFAKAQVVVVVTTSDFTSAAVNYAREITLSQPLQFLLIPGSVVRDYLNNGKDKLIAFVRGNAKEVMAIKRGQQLPAKE